MTTRRRKTRRTLHTSPDNISALRLAPLTVDQPTVELLEHLLDLAQRGELQGLACVTLRHGRRYNICWSDEAETNPIATLGALSRLVGELNKFADENGW